jgi:putative PIN family toxin of toxin-antitoxin system
MRVVADTNVVVSAFLWGGTPAKIIKAAREKTIVLYSSPALIAELEDVLARDKFSERLARVGSSVSEIVGDYRALAQIVVPASVPRVVRDVDDDQVIACALAAAAKIVVSRDNDLLALNAYLGIEILSAADAMVAIEHLA